MKQNHKATSRLINRLRNFDIMGNAHRATTMLCLIGLIVLLSVYSFYEGGGIQPNITSIIDSPDAHVSTEVALGNMRVVEVSESSVAVDRFGKTLRIKKTESTYSLEVGDVISIRGIVEHDTHVGGVLINPTFVREEQSGRYIKYATSVPPLLVIAYLFFTQYKFDFKSKEFVRITTTKVSGSRKEDVLNA